MLFHKKKYFMQKKNLKINFAVFIPYFVGVLEIFLTEKYTHPNI